MDWGGGGGTSVSGFGGRRKLGVERGRGWEWVGGRRLNGEE